MQSDQDAAVLDATVGVEELRPDGTHSRLHRHRDHLLEPLGMERLDVVVDQAHHLGVGPPDRGVVQRREVERPRVPVEHHVPGPGQGVEGGQRVRRVAAVVHEVDLVARVPVESADAPHAGLDQHPGVASRYDERDPGGGRGEAIAHVVQAGSEAPGDLGVDSGPLEVARERGALAVLIPHRARIEGREDHRQAPDLLLRECGGAGERPRVEARVVERRVARIREAGATNGE